MAIRLTTRLPYGCRKRLATILLTCRISPTNSRTTARRALFSTTIRSLTATTIQSTDITTDGRIELLKLLQELRARATGHVGLTRLQLAINNLQQRAGDETIRVAVLGVADGKSAQTAKSLIRALLADPLVEEQAWEASLENHDVATPLVVRIGKAVEGSDVRLISQPNEISELHVLAPTWDKHNIELLCVEDARLNAARAGELSEEDLLDVPTVVANQTLITPVHKTLSVADGILGVSTLGAISSLAKSPVTSSAINILGFPSVGDEKLPFIAIDVRTGIQGLMLFRDSLSNGIKYEKLWSQSNLPSIRDWILEGTKSSPEQTKAIVRSLISSVIEQTAASIHSAEAGITAFTTIKTDPEIATLNKALADWSESAHAELQDELDKAFGGSRWRQLKWWKLFWRVDDVGLLTSEILHDRFLPRADKSMIFLAGRISEGLPEGSVQYSQPMSIIPAGPVLTSPRETITAEQAAKLAPKWPTHIAFTRRYLHNETVPALQALSQKLVLQTLSSTGLSGVLGALIYASQFSVYEASSVVALGTVVSLRLMQRKWEEAQSFWEGDVREEGRKAVRAAEKSMADVLDGKAAADLTTGEVNDYSVIKGILDKARKALSKLR